MLNCMPMRMMYRMAMGTCAPPTGPTAPQCLDVVDKLAGGIFFETLLKAIKKAGLEGALRGAGPFTVFAPTDDAFSRVPAEALEDLTALKSILKYHVVSGRYLAADVANLRSATAMNGEKLPVEIVAGGVSVGGARILKTDIIAGNGVIHVIDQVLTPKPV
ncbi:MAG: fasciclin domain-containing protein [Bryobacteraceae bacterium]